MNDAETMYVIFLGRTVLGLLGALFALYLPFALWDYVLAFPVLTLGFLSGFLHPRTRHYRHALHEWNRSYPGIGVVRLHFVLCFILFCGFIVLACVFMAQPSVALGSLVGACISLGLVMVDGPQRRHYHDASEWEKTYRYIPEKEGA